MFCRGEYVNDVEGETWRVAFEHVDRLSELMALDKVAIHTLWTVNAGHLRRKIRDDPLILRVLKKTMPGYQGLGLTLYRGECQFLYAQNKIGFCWSPRIEVARCFARGLNAIESGGILLRAHAPAEAILAGPNIHSAQQMGEFEYTCDPERLQDIEVLQCFPKP
jgi:hypothetical protein